MLNENLEAQPTRAEQRDAQRGQILSIALNEFIQHGFAGTSTRSITRTAGVSSGLLFHYFPNKEAVYTELVRIGCSHLSFDLDAAQADPVGFLRNVVIDTLTMLRENPAAARFFVFMDYAQRTPGISTEADELLDQHRVIEKSTPVIEAGQANGSIKPGDPLALSLTFWSVLQGIAQEISQRPDLPLPDPEWILAIVLATPEVEPTA